MNKIQRYINWGKDKFFILLFAFMALYPASPLLLEYVSRDSGVFLFAGWRILNGDIPYVDFWDHKPPLIFFINAIGLWLYDGSRWGVWIIELISLWIAGYIGFRLLKNLFGTVSSSVVTFIWMFSFVFIVGRGNYTSEYVIPLQMATLYLFYKAQGRSDNLKLFFVMGLFGGFAFFTKQNTIGIWLSIIIYLLIKSFLTQENFNNTLKIIFSMLGGGLLVTMIISGYFFINNAFGAFWDSAFHYNFVYSTVNETLTSTRIKNFFDFRFISGLGLIHFSLLGLIFFIFLSQQKNIKFTNLQQSILILVLINFPLELIFINITGSPYEHYYTTILPALAISAGAFFYLFETKILQIDHSSKSNNIILLAIIGIFVLTGAVDYHYKRIAILKTRTNEPIIHYIQENTVPDDEILIWGAETMVNFHTKRNSPTRYVYQYPLTREGYTTEEMILEFLDDILQNKPKYIVDTLKDDMAFFVFPIHSQLISEKLNQIWSIYVEVDEINWWKVYQLSPK